MGAGTGRIRRAQGLLRRRNITEDGYQRYDAGNGNTGELWSENGVAHREDGPAEIYRDRRGRIWSEGWYLNGQLHREDGPAMSKTEDDDSLTEIFSIHGQPRSGAPSEIRHYPGGGVKMELYKISGPGSLTSLHREDGPAVLRYSPTGELEDEEYWLNAEKVTSKQLPSVINARADNPGLEPEQVSF